MTLHVAVQPWHQADVLWVASAEGEARFFFWQLETVQRVKKDEQNGFSSPDVPLGSFFFVFSSFD